MRRHKRPFGVTIIALLLLVNGAFASVRGAQELADLYHEQRGDIEAGRWVNLTQDLTLSEALTLPLTICGMVMAWGMWTLHPRAWFFTMALQGVYLAVHLYDYVEHEPSYVQMIITLGIVFYLNQRDVQLVFRPRPAPRLHPRTAPDER